MCFAMFQSVVDPEAAPVGPGIPEWAVAVLAIAQWAVWLGGMAIWLYLIWYCVTRDPERGIFLWLLIFLPVAGPVLYFFLRWLPQQRMRPPKFLRGLGRGRELRRLETAARQIGNAHQFVQWGDALRETGRDEQAAYAYAQALERESENIQALWGAGRMNLKAEEYDEAESRFRCVLEMDPEYKFGDVSLALGKALAGSGRTEEAKQQLEEHVSRWRHPEAMYLLAGLESESGSSEQARKYLEELIMDVESSPKDIARRHRVWRSRARRMLGRLS